MQFAHALDDRLTRFLIGRDAEGRIFGSQFRQSETELFLIGFRLRLNGDFDHRLREFHTLEYDGLAHIAERVTGADFLQTSKRNNVAGIGFFDVFTVIGMHEQHAADTLFLVLG